MRALWSDVEIVEHAASRVPGVVAVESELSWETDDRRHRVAADG